MKQGATPALQGRDGRGRQPRLVHCSWGAVGLNMQAVTFALVFGLVSTACGDAGGEADAGDGIDAAMPDAAVAQSVLEHLAAVGSWTLDTRIHEASCPECRTVAQYEFDAAGMGLAIVRYADVAGPSMTDGEEICRNVYSLAVWPTEGVDPLLRSGVTITLDSNTCGNPNGGTTGLIFDAATPIDQGAAEFMTVFGTNSQSVITPWPGFRESIDDTRFASLYRPCLDADRIPGRAYCAATCDTPATEVGEVACTYPAFDPNFPACNEVVNTATAVEQMNVAADLPTALGGTPLDGTYHLTAWNKYTGVSGASGGTGSMRTMTGVVAGEAVSMVTERGPGNRDHANYTMLNSGQFAIVTQVCPAAGGVPLDTFTAAGNQLIMYDTLGNASMEFTLIP